LSENLDAQAAAISANDGVARRSTGHFATIIGTRSPRARPADSARALLDRPRFHALPETASPVRP
jgi:hypothetical protein